MRVCASSIVCRIRGAKNAYIFGKFAVRNFGIQRISFQMMKDSITVVIDFGSSAIKAALIERYPDERYIIKQYHREAPSEGAIVRGKIHNLNDTAEKVRLPIQQLERDSGLTIKQVYAAVGGQSLRSHLHHMEHSFEEPHEVTEEDLREFQEQLDNFQPRYP